MKHEAGRLRQPSGLVEHPLLLALGAATLAAVGWGFAVFTLLL
jgi:hypothetical protein